MSTLRADDQDICDQAYDAWRDAENFVAPLARSQPPQMFDAERVLFEIRRQVRSHGDSFFISRHCLIIILLLIMSLLNINHMKLTFNIF